MQARTCTSLFSDMCKNNWRTKIQPGGKKFGKKLEIVILDTCDAYIGKVFPLQARCGPEGG